MPRPIRHRKMYKPPMAKGFRPMGMIGKFSQEVVLLLEEYESLKLSDYEGLTHAQAAIRMEVSRPTFSRIYGKARQKVAQAFVENRAIIIEGGNVNMTDKWYRCEDCNALFSYEDYNGEISCYSCKSTNLTLVNSNSIKPLRSKKRRVKYSGFCICPSCGFKIGHSLGMPCRKMDCPVCHEKLMRDNLLTNNTKMKIAISCSGDNLDAHFNTKFGRADFFAIVADEGVSFVKNPAAEANSGAGPMAVEFLASQGVTKVVSGHFGPKAEQALNAFSMEMVMFSDENKTIDNIKNQFK